MKQSQRLKSMDAVEQRFKQADFEAAAVMLWEILDEIDTTDDMVTGNDAAYRKRVQGLMVKRFDIFVSDGYSLFHAKTKIRVEKSATVAGAPTEWAPEGPRHPEKALGIEAGA